MSHHKLSASSAYRWTTCPGSVHAIDQLPQSDQNKTSSYAEEGTLAHEVAQAILTNKKPPEHPEDMVEYVQQYVDYITQHNLPTEIEQKVSFDPYISGGFGTCDAILHDEPNKQLIVVDLKYGKGVRVNVKDNLQLILYAIGAVKLPGNPYKIKTVKMVVHQPRLDHVDEHTLNIYELVDHANKLKQKAKEISPTSVRVPGEAQCRFCPVKAVCPALLQLTHDTVLQEFDTDELSDQQLSKALTNKKLINLWLDAVEQHVKERLNNNQPFPGFKLVNGRASRKWVEYDDLPLGLLHVIPEATLYKQVMLSPAQIEKKVTKEQYQNLAPFINKSTSLTMVPDCDPRAAKNINEESFDKLDK